ncbi:MAG: hypothetical protein IKX00_04600 [Bacilli bacterium]|nr:hypothetical protein [Bacilli bacterium]
MKRILFLLIAIFIISGCEATYTIDVDNDFFESTVITTTDSDEFSEIQMGSYPYKAYYNDDTFEDITGDVGTEIENDNIVYKKYNTLLTDKLIYSYRFGEDYQDSNIAYRSVNEFVVIDAKDENAYSKIYANDFSNVFNEYPGLTKLTINVKVSKKVLNSNADSNSGNIYTWIITRKNQNREISISFADERYFNPDENIIQQPDDVIVPDNNDPNSNTDPDNGKSSVPDNGSEKNKNKNTSDKGLTEKQSKVVLYVLYALFFGLIFGIIIFRTFKNNIKIKK